MSRSFMRIRPQYSQGYPNLTTREGIYVHASKDHEKADCGFGFSVIKRKWFTKDDVNCPKCLTAKKESDGQPLEPPDL